MKDEEVIDIVDDRLEKRFESYAQAQIKIHEEYHTKLLQAVKEEIKVTVNGKIDKIQKQMDTQDTTLNELKQLLEDKKFISQLWGFLKVVGGTAMAIGSAIIMYNQIKQ